MLTVINVPLLILADEIVQLLSGAKWSAAAPILRVLALLGFFVVICDRFTANCQPQRSRTRSSSEGR